MSSCSCLFALSDFEVWVFKAKNRMDIFNKFGKYPTLKVIYVFDTVLGSICKKILFGWVTMKVHIKLDPLKMSLSNFQSELMKSFNFGEHIRIEILKLPVQIFSWIWGSVISNNHTIYIYHWNDVKYKRLS